MLLPLPTPTPPLQALSLAVHKASRKPDLFVLMKRGLFYRPGGGYTSHIDQAGKWEAGDAWRMSDQGPGWLKRPGGSMDELVTAVGFVPDYAESLEDIIRLETELDDASYASYIAALARTLGERHPSAGAEDRCRCYLGLSVPGLLANSRLLSEVSGRLP